MGTKWPTSIEWRRRAVPLLAAVCMASGALGCRESTICPEDLQVRVTPVERTIAVGESFTPSAQAFGCGGTRRLSDTWTWDTEDTEVVTVDPPSGRTTGRAPGTACVRARGEKYGVLGAGVHVTVR